MRKCADARGHNISCKLWYLENAIHENLYFFIGLFHFVGKIHLRPVDSGHMVGTYIIIIYIFQVERSQLNCLAVIYINVTNICTYFKVAIELPSCYIY